MPRLQLTSIVSVLVFAFPHLAVINSIDSMEVKDICSNTHTSIKEVGPDMVLEVGPNKIPALNPCVMRVDTCAHCRLEIEPYGKDFSLLGCDRNYDTTGKSCPMGCQYLYIFDQFYKNQTMSFYRDSSTTNWNLHFVSESSVVFIGFCHGNLPLNKSIQLRVTTQAKEEIHKGSSDMSTSGEIVSPFFPDLYSLNSEYYSYLIESINPNDYIYLIFTDWDLSATSSVFVEWGNSEVLYRYSDDRPVIMANSHKVKIMFDTGYEYQHGVLRSNMGFRVKYSYVNADLEYKPVPSTNCGQYTYSSGGKLALDTSSTISYKYYDCVWVVRTAPLYTDTLLNIISFIVGKTSFESDDFLEIYSGLSSKGKNLTNIRRGDAITTWQYKDPEGFYIHLFGKFGHLDKVLLSYASLNMEKLCSSSYDLWRCNNGYCISSKYKCDGVDHCGDNSDEQYRCLGSGSPWQKSSQQTLAFSVVIPVVISVFLIIILFVLFLLVRRYRRAQRDVIRRTSEGLPSISEDLSRPHGRRRRRRHRGVIGEDLPPAYEEAIRSPPMYPDISLDPPGPGHWMLPKPPPYSESVATPTGPPMPPCFERAEPTTTECPSNSSSDSSESEQWDGPRTNHLTDDSSDASPIPRVRATHSYSTSYSSESSFENSHSPRQARYAVTDTEPTERRRSRSPPRQDRLTELPIRQLLVPDTEGLPQDRDRHKNHQTDRHYQGLPPDRRSEQHRQDTSTRQWRGNGNHAAPTERPTDRVHRNRHHTDRHQLNLSAERRADHHFQDQPGDRQVPVDRREEVRRNLFKSSDRSPNRIHGKSSTRRDDYNKHRLSPAKVETGQIDDSNSAKISNGRKQRRSHHEDERLRAPHDSEQPGGRPNQLHTSMPNIANPQSLSRPGFQSLNNFSSAGVIPEATTSMSGNIQPKHRQYAKSLENISQVAGSQALRPFLFDSDQDPERSGPSRKSWSPREPVNKSMCEENPGSREALCGDSNSLVRPEFSGSSGCVNAAFCESPTRELPPEFPSVSITQQRFANLPRGQTDMHVPSSDRSGSRSHVPHQPRIRLRSDSTDNEDNECYA